MGSERARCYFSIKRDWGEFRNSKLSNTTTASLYLLAKIRNVFSNSLISPPVAIYLIIADYKNHSPFGANDFYALKFSLIFHTPFSLKAGMVWRRAAFINIEDFLLFFFA